jgi:hypothetical protein
MNVLQKWMARATPQEKSKLAIHSKISRGALQWLAGGYRTSGKVQTSPEVARRIELASHRIQREGLPAIRREDLCPACARCEYAKLNGR